MEKIQSDINDNQTVKNEENTFFKWVIGILIGVLFTFIGVIYGSLTSADISAQASISELQDNETLDNLRFQNLEANVYLLCRAQRLDCIPPINK